MGFSQRVAEVIKQIPKGKVTTYGTVAALAGSPRAALMVGRFLARTKIDLPWHRVIGKGGYITIVNPFHPAEEQVALLRSEGVRVKDQKPPKVEIGKYQWHPSE